MKKITSEMCAITPINSPSPLAYINVFEEGDIWLKTQGCEACTKEGRERCCINCTVLTPFGCGFQTHTDGRGPNKPFQCVVKPAPDQGHSWCALEFTCIKGSKKGKIRRIRESLEEIKR